MKQFNFLRFLYLIFSLFSIIYSDAQVQTPRYISIPGANSNGFYEYLPLGYNPTGTKTYPLILFVHGAGETGNGTTELPLILRHGPPNMINWNITNPGTFPDSFVVSGISYRYIVISPQFKDWPMNAQQVNAVLNYVLANYKVNVNKVYLTGLSVGGGATWEFAGTPAYASKIAAIAPMAGSMAPSLPFARVIAANNIAVWAFQNDTDFVTPPWYTTTWVQYINQPPAPIPPARLTMFRRTDHDCWSIPYLPAWEGEIINGVRLNLYQWFLTITRQSNSIILPVTLSEYKALLTGPTQITVTWTTTQETNNDHFTLERSTDGINFTTIAVISATNSSSAHTYTYKDDSPITGINIYRLSQTDVDGKVKYFDTLKVSIVSKRQQPFVINPNPVRDKLTLDLYHEEKGLIQVILQDINGKTLRNWKFDKTADQWRQSINISEISRGMYVITVVGKSLRESQKMIKE